MNRTISASSPGRTTPPPWSARGVLVFLAALVAFELLVRQYLRVFEFPVTVISNLIPEALMNGPAAKNAAGLLIVLGVRMAMLFGLIHFITVHWKSSVRQTGIDLTHLRRDLYLTLVFVLFLAAAAGTFWLAARFLFQTDISRFAVPGGETLDHFRSPAYTIVFFLTACVCAPVVEELVFRGFVYPPIRNHLKMLFGTSGVLFAILINTLLFTFFHAQWGRPEIYPETVSALFSSGMTRETLSGLAAAWFPLLLPFTGGILFCALYQITGRITAPVLLHAAGNTGLLVLTLIHACTVSNPPLS